MARTPIFPPNAPRPIAPYSPGIAVGPGATVYVSGQIAIDPATQQFAGGDVAAQTHLAMRNLGAVLEAAGAGYGDVVKTTIYLRDMADFPAVNDAYAGYFAEPYPARATVQVARLPRDAAVEIDAIAVVAG